MLSKEHAMEAFTDFKTRVTGDALEESDYFPCLELHVLCDLMNAPRLTSSPYELYPTHSPISCISMDRQCFVTIDATGPEDGMSMVGLRVRCRSEVANQVEGLIRSIRERSQVQTALLRGNLRLLIPE